MLVNACFKTIIIAFIADLLDRPGFADRGAEIGAKPTETIGGGGTGENGPQRKSFLVSSQELISLRVVSKATVCSHSRSFRVVLHERRIPLMDTFWVSDLRAKLLIWLLQYLGFLCVQTSGKGTRIEIVRNTWYVYIHGQLANRDTGSRR